MTAVEDSTPAPAGARDTLSPPKPSVKELISWEFAESVALHVIRSYSLMGVASLRTAVNRSHGLEAPGITVHRREHLLQACADIP